jgi:hypothetical protein
MFSRQITIDGQNFGIQTRYVQVLLEGIPYRLHPFGEAIVHQDHICCHCQWQCFNYPRECRCSPPHLDPIVGTCVDQASPSACSNHLIDVCKIFSLHDQIQTAVPNIYNTYNQGLLPFHGVIPKQGLSPTQGDKQFQLCVVQDSWCPLSIVPGAYQNWFLTVSCPSMPKAETQLIVDYKGVSGTDAGQFYMVTLKDALSSKPDCDDVLKICCTYVLSFQDPFLNQPTFNFYDNFHGFPGFCGQHIIRVVVDGYQSPNRAMNANNLNMQSLIYLDDKPVRNIVS